MSGWTGVDLDGTLAEYHGWKGGTDIGKPIPKMVKRVKKWLKEGREVRIFTARVALDPKREQERAIRKWCEEHVGKALLVTNEKDYGMVELWDDRAVQVRVNTGEPVDLQRRKD